MASPGPRDTSAQGAMAVLTVVFVCLKLGGAIDWSWWIVLGPLWIPLAIGIAFYAGMWIAMLVFVGCVRAVRTLTPARRKVHRVTSVQRRTGRRR